MRNRLKQLKRRSEHAHYFYDEVDLMSLSEGEEVEARHMRHRMAGRIGVRAAQGQQAKVWSLKFFDTVWVEQQPGDWAAQRVLYKFEWNRLRTEMSQRTAQLIGTGYNHEVGDMADAIDNFSVSDNELALLYAQTEFESVNSDDCDLLMQDAEQYFRMVQTIEL